MSARKCKYCGGIVGESSDLEIGHTSDCPEKDKEGK